MNFLNPYYLFLLTFVPAIAVGAALSRRHKNTQWKKLVAARLEKSLIIRHRTPAFLISTILSLIALTCLIFAVARPYAGQTTINEKVESRNILIAVDVSKSMLCQDTSPDRLTAAKALGIQLIDAFPNDNIGALAFAGTPYVVCPLTIDHQATRDTISQLDPLSAPTEGSDLIAAIKAGAKTLKQTGHRANALIVLSDGSENQDDLESAIRYAKESNVQIFTIGVGTPTGGVIPDTDDPNKKHRDRSGRVVYTKLEDKTLRQLAESTDGIYIPINNNPKQTIATAISKMKTFEQEGREKVIPHELYHWFLIPGCILAIAAAFVRAKWKFPTQTAPAIILLTLAFPQTLPASEWWDNLKRDHLDQPSLQKEGLQALQNKDYEKAEDYLSRAHKIATGENKAQLAIALGQAQFRQKKFTQAASTYSSALLSEKTDSQKAAYLNTAHSLFKQQWDPLNIKSIPELKPALTAALQNKNKNQGLALKKSDLETMVQGFTNARSKYQDIPTKDKAINDYILSTTQIINIIEKLLKNPPQENQDQQDKEDQEKKDEKKDNPDDQDPNKDDKNEGDQGDKPDDQQQPQDPGDKGDQDEPQDKPGENPDESENKNQKGDTDQDPNKQPNEKPDDKKDGEQSGNKGDSNDDETEANEEPQPDSENQDPKSTADKARGELKKHADLQRRPTGNKSRWRGKPPVDW